MKICDGVHFGGFYPEGMAATSHTEENLWKKHKEYKKLRNSFGTANFPQQACIEMLKV